MNNPIFIRLLFASLYALAALIFGLQAGMQQVRCAMHPSCH